jgi:predicted TIM-barrel fold metal-dependent hydrolase
MFDEHLYAFHSLLTREGEKVSRARVLREWSVDEIYEMVIEGSDTDMIAAPAAAAHRPLPRRPVAVGEVRRDGRQAPGPGGLLGLGEPARGQEGARPDELQVEDHGAKAFKFYNVRYDYGQPFPWRMDDPRDRLPGRSSSAQELGVNLIGVHKGVPLGPQPVEHTRTFDMDGAAANFPDINFVIFHVGLPWLDEVLWQIVRFPNLYASIAATVNFIARQPRVFAETLGKMLWWCGEDKIIYGGESPIWHPQWALEEFWNFELPRDIVEERGYPQLTEQAKRKILGENLARLHGIDVDAKKKDWGCRREPDAAGGLPAPRRGARWPRTSNGIGRATTPTTPCSSPRTACCAERTASARRSTDLIGQIPQASGTSRARSTRRPHAAALGGRVRADAHRRRRRHVHVPRRADRHADRERHRTPKE